MEAVCGVRGRIARLIFTCHQDLLTIDVNLRSPIFGMDTSPTIAAAVAGLLRREELPH